MSAARIAGLLALMPAIAGAHIGSPDVFFQGKAGPYPLLVVIRPPDVIPGVARIEVRALSDDVRRIELTPTPISGEGAKHPPVADLAERSASDPRLFTGSLWLMSFGSWEVHVRAAGARGTAEIPVPVPALALKTKLMDPATGWLLAGMMMFLGTALVAIVGAAVHEAKIEPGAPVGGLNRRAVLWMAFTAVLLVSTLAFGKSWWAGDAASYSGKLYKPLALDASLAAGNHLDLRLTDPGWLAMRRLDDLIPDHGHIMHFFLVRWPAMDLFFHLHPDQASAGYFADSLPPLAAGRYKMFADIVHENGLAETAAGEIQLPDMKGATLEGDDAGGLPGPAIEWIHDASHPVFAKQVNQFEFRPADGSAIEPYMGMAGHAEFIKSDGTVFAHIHPSGSVPMAAMNLASHEAMMAMHAAPGSTVSFPFGVPSPGRYKIFVQIKHGGRVDTSAFNLEAR